MILPKYTPKESLDRIKLIMNYNSLKTLTENKFEILSEGKGDDFVQFLRKIFTPAVKSTIQNVFKDDVNMLNIIKKIGDNAAKISLDESLYFTRKYMRTQNNALRTGEAGELFDLIAEEFVRNAKDSEQGRFFLTNFFKNKDETLQTYFPNDKFLSDKISEKMSKLYPNNSIDSGSLPPASLGGGQSSPSLNSGSGQLPSKPNANGTTLPAKVNPGNGVVVSKTNTGKNITVKSSGRPDVLFTLSRTDEDLAEKTIQQNESMINLIIKEAKGKNWDYFKWYERLMQVGLASIIVVPILLVLMENDKIDAVEDIPNKDNNNSGQYWMHNQIAVEDIPNKDNNNTGGGNTTNPETGSGGGNTTNPETGSGGSEIVTKPEVRGDYIYVPSEAKDPWIYRYNKKTNRWETKDQKNRPNMNWIDVNPNAANDDRKKTALKNAETSIRNRYDKLISQMLQ